MAFYVALGDDTVADRKHLERLLERENANRIRELGALYVDSFGDGELLFSSAPKYNLMMLDFVHGEKNALALAAELRAMGIRCPMALMSSTIDYSVYSHALPDVRCLKKPTSLNEISDCINWALSYWKKQKPLIEIRTEHDSYYATENEIILARQEGHLVLLSLTGGRSLEMLGTLSQFMILVDNYPAFIETGRHTCVNAAHVQCMEGGRLLLDEGHQVPIGMLHRKELMKKITKFKSTGSLPTL